jgi:hypothetical protein
MIRRMTHSTALYVAIFATASLAVGWYGAKAWIAHGDVGGSERKIPGLKRARNRNGGIAMLLIITGLLVLYGLVTKHG